MVFNSVVFLFCFLPLSLLLYYLVPGRAKNAVLLAESLIFYCWTGVAFLPLIAVLIVFNYLWALLTARAKAKLRGLLPLAAVLVNLGVLVYFKYANFLIDTVNQVAHLGLAALNIGTVLPLGISYYIFKIISYEVDVCTGKIAPEKNFITFAVYVLFFPQLIVGPIVKYREMADQLHDGANRCTPARAEHGAELFVFGLAKKVILADSIGALWTDIIGAGGVGLTNVSTPLAWLGIIAYSLQLYFDFAGYSEMSNGLAALMGFDCAANFDLPYISASITEFWRRWHMSLGTFFRDYVYIPLGGNRVSTPRFVANTMIVWGLTGIWHGAAWNFLLWGLYWGVLILLEKFLVMKVLDKLPRFVSHIWCVVLFFFGWLLFAVTGLSNVGEWFCAMFGAYGWLGTSTLWELQSWSYVSLVPVFIVGSLPWAPWLRKKIQAWAEGDPHRAIVAAPQKGNTAVPPCQVVCEGPVPAGRARAVTAVNVLADVALLAVFVLSCMSVVSSSYNPFIYFQF